MQTSELIRNLFKEFHDNDIIYCHWKSNEHLDASFRGDTDFDVLFDKSQKNNVEKIFNRNGFVLFQAPFNRRYSEIVDFIGVDYEQNKIIHFHTHYHLEIGTSGLKEYHYTIEEEILSKRVFSTDFECYIIDPRYEFLLLIIRLSLKVKNNWKSNFHLNKEVENSNRELRWLKERVSLEQLIGLIKELEIPYKEEDITRIYDEEFEYNTLYSLSLKKNQIKDLKKQSNLKIQFTKWSKWLYFQYGRVLRKTGLSYVAKRRVNLEGGFSIAILGSDGSGKSTQKAILNKLFFQKIDVESFYLGSNKGTRSYHRRFLENCASTWLAKSNKFFESFFTLLVSFSAAFEKKIRIKRAKRLKDNGVLIIFDRFPQHQTYGYNDGPRLKRAINSQNSLLKAIGEFEKKLYMPSKNEYPDILFKLIANPKTLSKRRNMSVVEAEQKQNGILDLHFDNKIPIVKIDADQSIESVTSNILKEISRIWLKLGDSKIEN